MVFSESMQFGQNTSDNLNPADTTVPLLKKNDETIRLREKTTKVSQETIGHSWIVGSSTNGIVGANTNTQDGEQQVVGGAGRTATLLEVQNPNDRFIETFRFDTFIDTGNSTGSRNETKKSGTATVDTSTWGEVITLS